jgi:ABC-type antimicrobial peptide transport system permease subunit
VPPDPFYTQTMDLIDMAVMVALVIAGAGLVVAVVESIVTNRRAYASLVATGVPRAVLARSILTQTLAPALPAILLAVAVGIAIPRSLVSESRSGDFPSQACVASEAVCADPAQAGQHLRTVVVPEVIMRIPVPYGDLAFAGLVGLAAVLGTAAIGLLFLRSSTELEELRTT